MDGLINIKNNSQFKSNYMKYVFRLNNLLLYSKYKNQLILKLI